MDSTQFTSDEVDLEGYRARLRKMTDEELILEGKAGRYLCSPMANFGKPPRKVFVVQLEEVKAEWRHKNRQIAISEIQPRYMVFHCSRVCFKALIPGPAVPQES
jgi:hypothetical protein